MQNYDSTCFCMGEKLGLSPQERNTDWGRLKTGRWGEHEKWELRSLETIWGQFQLLIRKKGVYDYTMKFVKWKQMHYTVFRTEFCCLNNLKYFN